MLQILAEKGFIAACVPALAFQYINLDILEQRLMRPGEYSGLILTSQNSVEACHKVNNTSDSISGWNGKLNYTVGEATQLKGVLMNHGLPNSWFHAFVYTFIT